MLIKAQRDSIPSKLTESSTQEYDSCILNIPETNKKVHTNNICYGPFVSVRHDTTRQNCFASIQEFCLMIKIKIETVSSVKSQNLDSLRTVKLALGLGREFPDLP